MKVNMVGAVRSAVGQRAALAVKVVSYARNDSEGRYRKKFAPPPICTTLCLQRLRSNLQELAHTWGCARFMTRKRQAFPCVRRSVCGIASAAVLAETCSAMWSIRRTSTFVMPSSFWPTKYHIELRYDQSNAKKEHTGSKRARLLEANEAAQEFFVSQLMTKRRARRAQTA